MDSDGNLYGSFLYLAVASFPLLCLEMFCPEIQKCIMILLQWYAANELTYALETGKGKWFKFGKRQES